MIKIKNLRNLGSLVAYPLGLMSSVVSREERELPEVYPSIQKEGFRVSARKETTFINTHVWQTVIPKSL